MEKQITIQARLEKSNIDTLFFVVKLEENVSYENFNKLANR